MSTTPGGRPAAQAFRPSGDQTIKFLQANAALGETRRYRELDRREAHYRCRQYEHQKLDWWGRAAEYTETISPGAVFPMGFEPAGGRQIPDGVTVRDKRPTAPLQLVKQIVDRFTEMVFSDERKPKITVDRDPDTQALLEEIQKESDFWPIMRGARDKGGSIGSVLMTVHLREGRFAYEIHNTKDCTVLWKDKRTWSPQAILKMYRYPVEEDVVDKKTGELIGTREVTYLYRRIITDQVDVVYMPVKMEPGQMNADWVADPALTVEHNLGYFPGVWIQNKQDSDSLDGDADCEGAWQLCDAADRLTSQMNYGVLHNLDPTPVIGVDEKQIVVAGGLRKGSDNALYVGVDGHASYMEMTGSSIEASDKLLDRYVTTALNICRCVLVDPEKISGAAQSAKAIEYIYAPMLGRCGDFRSQYGTAVVKLMRITEKMCRAFMGRSVQLEGGVIGVFKLDLPPRVMQSEAEDGSMQEIVTEHRLGPGGHMSLSWGPYFSPTKTDDQQEIANAASAKDAGLIDKVTAARKIAPIFGVTDVEGTVNKAREEQQADAETMMGAAGGGVFGDDQALGGGGGSSTPPKPPAPTNEHPNPGAKTPPGGTGGKP